MPITEEKAQDILIELIKKPEVHGKDVPTIWGEILSMHNSHFANQTTGKKRRRAKNPNLGWPAGVGREEFKTWKEKQIAKGVTENLNPQAYKRFRDGEVFMASEPTKTEKAPTTAAKNNKTAAKTPTKSTNSSKPNGKKTGKK